MITTRRARGRRSLRCVLLLVTSLLLTIVVTPSASATAGTCQEDGNYETCFTYGGGSEDRLIAAKIKAKIDATADAAAAGETGDYIRVALYDWDTDGGGTAVASSLVRAANSGVSVRVVIGSAEADIKSELAKADIDISYCPNSCMVTSSGAMHNKIFLIKKGDTELVLQSSSNFGLKQAQHAQNLLISRDDDALFSAYVNYWRRLYSGLWTYDNNNWDTNTERTIDGTNDLSKAYFYPQPDATRVEDVLGNVSDCATGNNRIWMEASLLESSGYSLGIIDQLRRLDLMGCDVKVIIQKQAGKDVLLSHNISATDIHCDGWSHNKLLLIDAKYAGEWRKAVFVGSYNITENSAYRSNDAMLRIVNGWVTNRYIDQFQYLWTHEHACD